MIRDGIEYEHLPASVDLASLRTVATPWKSGISKLELTRELIEQLHQEAQSLGADRVYVGDLQFEYLDGADGLRAYTFTVFERFLDQAA